MGRIFDDVGNRMTPVHSRKGSLRYRYYVSASSDGDTAESVLRIPAARAEQAVITAVRKQLHIPSDEQSKKPDDIVSADIQGQRTIQGTGSGAVKLGQQELAPYQIVERYVERVAATKQGLTITLTAQAIPHSDDADRIIKVTLYVRGGTVHHQIIQNQTVPASRRKTLKTERRLTLLTTIAKARQWVDELTSGRIADINNLAAREGCSERNIRRALSLAFLAPDIVQAAIDGKLPPDLVMTRISSDLPLSWSQQREALALA
jgi:hypothetical protein